MANARIVGLDIGSATVRAVEVRGATTATPTIVHLGEEPLPAGAVSRGEVVDPHVVGATVKRLWASGGFTSRNVILGMGNHRVAVRNLTVPRMSLRRIRESLPFQVQELLSFPVHEALLDFYPISELAADANTDEGARIQGLLIAAVKEAVLANVLAVKLAGLTAVDVDLIPFALSRVISRGSTADQVVAQIDVGAATTSVLISAGRVPQFVRLIPAGGIDVTKALKLQLGLGDTAAETLKRSLTDGNVAAANPVAARVVRDITHELLLSLRNTVTYFSNTRPDLAVARIVLTGGGSQLGEMAHELTDLTRLPVTAPPGEPFGISFASVALAGQLGSARGAYLVACGLALGSSV
ncbi:type IV pilus assembly protein PilM [Cryobacterium sp. PH31-L1]|uniref:type IV pilus assembly protein PilM n=1 Tax=Cryobacterium sp. PH31-L1 TaxID=3046199 RepID=UPI0024BB2718|nr:type IV pilus assembly protein PilM [Cryobacterium sp. PH31-L1]MDJ0375998.1 type IV pilus assembly protein PilM [Cryobacterium sp. PH31-L1]